MAKMRISPTSHLSIGLSMVALALTTEGCAHNAYLDQSLSGAIGKDKPWVEKQYGAPNTKASRFFGGESWTYYRIAGGKSSLPLFNFSPNECQITMKFDKDERVSDYSYSGC